MQKLSKLFQLAGDGKNLSKTLNDKTKKPEEILLDSWKIILQDFVRKYQYKPEGTLQLFYSDRKNYEELAYKESTLACNSEGLPFKVGPQTLRDVITTEFIYEIKKFFLISLNRAVIEIAKEVASQAHIFLEKRKLSFREADNSLKGYEIGLVVSYFIKNYDHAAYTFSSTFDYHQIAIEKNQIKLHSISINNESDIHRKQNLPILNDRYGFLLVDIINNGSLKDKIYEIEKIEAAIIITGYEGLKMNKDKNSIAFQYNENTKIFEESHAN